MGHMGTHAAAVALYPNLAYDPRTDFVPIGLAVETPEVLVTRKDLPPNSLKEFVAYAKQNEAKLNMGHSGVGSISYVGCLLLNSAIGISPTLVPFTGSSQVTNALLGGQVDYFCDPIVAQMAHVQAHSLKGLAIATAERHPLLPDVPTAAEQGLPQFSAAPFYALFAPKDTPAPVVERLSAALDQALDDDGLRKRLGDLGAAIPEKSRRGPAPMAALVKSEIARLTRSCRRRRRSEACVAPMERKRHPGPATRFASPPGFAFRSTRATAPGLTTRADRARSGWGRRFL